MKQRLYKDFFYHFDIAFMIVLNVIIVVVSLFWDFSLLLVLIYLVGMVTFMASEYISNMDISPPENASV